VPFFGDDEEHDPELTPLTARKAVTCGEQAHDRRLEFEDAFPDIEYATRKWTPKRAPLVLQADAPSASLQ